MHRGQEKRERTIQARTTKHKQEFLEQIKKTPIIQIACEKIGVGRATVYRWRELDQEFSGAMDRSLLEGKLLVNDVAESQLMAAIRERNMTAIVFWLKHNHPSYATKVEVTARIQETHDLTPEQRTLVEEALRRAALPSPEPATSQNG